MQENLRSEQTAEKSGYQKRDDGSPAFLREFSTIGESAREGPWPKRGGAGGIRGDGSHVGDKKSRERYEASASCNGIQCACYQSGEEQKDGLSVRQEEMVGGQFEIVSAKERSVSYSML